MLYYVTKNSLTSFVAYIWRLTVYRVFLRNKISWYFINETPVLIICIDTDATEIKMWNIRYWRLNKKELFLLFIEKKSFRKKRRKSFRLKITFCQNRLRIEIRNVMWSLLIHVLLCTLLSSANHSQGFVVVILRKEFHSISISRIWNCM